VESELEDQVSPVKEFARLAERQSFEHRPDERC
jgi:hypothetical protein